MTKVCQQSSAQPVRLLNRRSSAGSPGQLHAMPSRLLALPNCTVGFVYNEPCPLKCDFCCHTKENVGPGHFSAANTTPIVIAFSKNDHVTRFAFTGGDPFVYIRDITMTMREARAHGVWQPFHIVTSGYWAKSQELVDIRIEELAGIGMDRLYVSYDYEHAKWVTPEQVYLIEEACIRHNVQFCVYGVFWNQGERTEHLLPNLKTNHVESSLVAPIGRALTAGKPLPMPMPESNFSCGKPQDYDVTIYPNGDAYPCCSGGFNKKAGLLLGNVFTNKPEEIIRSCLSNFLAIIAKEIGFDKLISRMRFLNSDMLAIPAFDKIHSVCELCSIIGGDMDARRAAANAVAELEVEYCIKRFSDLTNHSNYKGNENDSSISLQSRHDRQDQERSSVSQDVS